MSATKTLWWVRHAPTHAKTMIGWTDLPADLSDTETLARLNDYLPAGAPVVASDLTRARTTADALSADRPRLPDRPGLRELNFGDWEGRSFAEIEAEDPEHIFAYWDQPGSLRAPGGESWHDLTARIHDEVTTLLTSSGPDLIVVAHMGVIMTQVERAKGLSTKDVFAQKIDNLSVTRLTFADEWAADAVNHKP